MRKSRDGYRNVERIIKGAANHRRVEILTLLKEYPELSVSELATRLKIDLRTASEHIRKLVHAGLVMKRSDSVSVRQRLTYLGEHILRFLETIANQ